MSYKLFKITQHIKKYMHEYPPSAVGIERLYVPPKGKGIASAEVNYRVHGIINCLLYKVPQYYYTPSQIKMNVQNGRAPKNVVKACLIYRFPELKSLFKHNNYGTRKDPKWTDEDQADACGACLSLLLEERLITYDKPLLKEIKPIIVEEDELNKFLLKSPKEGKEKAK